MSIIAILADRGRHGRAQENSNFPSDIAVVDPWEDLLDAAKRKGFSVTDNGNYVNFYRDSDGSWAKATRKQRESNAKPGRCTGGSRIFRKVLV